MSNTSAKGSTSSREMSVATAHVASTVRARAKHNVFFDPFIPSHDTADREEGALYTASKDVEVTGYGKIEYLFNYILRTPSLVVHGCKNSSAAGSKLVHEGSRR